jgi:hypothetical protein
LPKVPYDKVQKPIITLSKLLPLLKQAAGTPHEDVIYENIKQLYLLIKSAIFKKNLILLDASANDLAALVSNISTADMKVKQEVPFY